MHRKLIAFAATAVAAAMVAGGAAGSGSKVMVVMHDPGCHWFQVGGKYKTSLARTGPVKISNYDEATIRVRGVGKTRLIKVGASARLTRGKYVIRMVKQASDDNTLHLTVR